MDARKHSEIEIAADIRKNPRRSLVGSAHLTLESTANPSKSGHQQMNLAMNDQNAARVRFGNAPKPIQRRELIDVAMGKTPAGSNSPASFRIADLVFVDP